MTILGIEVVMACTNRSRHNGVFCGQCQANLRGRAAHQGHLGCKTGGSYDGRKRMALSKPVGTEGASGEARKPDLDTWGREHPNLIEYCTGEQWSDGSARITASLLCFYEQGLFKVCLNDRALERTAWATGPSFAACHAALEAGLAHDRLEWRRQAGRKTRK